MSDLNCKLLIIGAGPGGYVCGVRAGQLGIDTIVVEAEKPGGTCLNVGCIPSKALIHAADEFYKISNGNNSVLGINSGTASIDLAQTVVWKDSIVARLNSGVTGLLKKAKTRYISGTARFLDGKTVTVHGTNGTSVISAENIVIATGSAPAELASMPFGGNVISSTEALSFSDVPKHFAVVGGGYIGLEIGTAMAKLGAQVTIIEFADKILPQYDAELTKPILKRLNELNVNVLTNTSAKKGVNGGVKIECSDGSNQIVQADKILVAVGRRPRLNALGIEELSLTMNGAFIGIDDKCQTSMRGVYAIGDVTGDPMLAHRAMAQGEMVAEIIAGHAHSWDKACIPAVCFTDPEIVDCGLSHGAAKEAGFDIITGQFPFQANGRAMTMGAEAGFVRVVARSDNHVVLGLQAVGCHVSELSAAFTIAIEMGARLEDIAATVHAHPTQSEALQEASMMALGKGLHF